MTPSLTPWPIEKHSHPINSLADQRGMHRSALEIVDGKTDDLTGPLSIARSDFRLLSEVASFAENPDLLESRQFVEMCFKHPQIFRDSILRHARVEASESFKGKGTFYVWLNKACPVGCDFCFFRSPAKAQTEITSGDEGIGKLIKFINDAGMERLFISGGGEPMMKADDVNRIAREVDVDRIILVTSAFFGLKKDGATKAVNGLRDGLAANPNAPAMTLRLSLDSGHIEKLGARGKGGFSYVHHLLEALQETAPDGNDPISFLIHTMMGDETVERLLAELPVKSRVDSGPEFKRRTHVILEGGFEFDIEYSQLFQSNTDIDMDSAEAEFNIAAFNDYVRYRANGNMTLAHNAHADSHQDGPHGVDWLVLYDGTATHWSSTVPDNEPSIYRDTYDKAMQRHLDDVITLALLEKGTFYRDDIVAEVSPKAVARARAIGLRDQYPRVLFEEERIRLYASVRIVQDYVEEGRITDEQISQWPPMLQALIKAPRNLLANVCEQSSHDILDQYLVDPTIGFQKLMNLYKMVRLGHYDLTPTQMLERVLASNISRTVKYEFACATWTCDFLKGYVEKFQTPEKLVAAYAYA